MTEKIYRLNERGYMVPTKESITRCINCKNYADEIVTTAPMAGSYCKHWRMFVKPHGWCYEAKAGKK